MDIFVIIFIAALFYWLYRSGKRAGSRQGYGVGRQRGRAGGRRRRR